MLGFVVIVITHLLAAALGIIIGIMLGGKN